MSRALIADNVPLSAMSSVSGSGRLFPQPRVPLGVDAGVVGIQVDKAPLYLEVADLEDVAPPARSPLRFTSPPWTVPVLPEAGTFDGQRICTREDPVERRIVVGDGMDCLPDIAEELADLLLAVSQTPLGKVDLCVVGEELEDAVASRRHPTFVECLEVLKRHRLALLVGHCSCGYRHVVSSSAVSRGVGSRRSCLAACSGAKNPRVNVGPRAP